MIRSALAASLALLALSALSVSVARADTVAGVERLGGPLPIPPGARYHEACSQAMGVGRAVFTFNLEPNPEGFALLRSMTDAGVIPLDTSELDRKLEGGAQGAAVRSMEALLKTQGLKPVDQAMLLTTYVRPAGNGHGPLEIGVASFNTYALPGGVCGGLMPLGPVLFFSAG